MNRAFIRPEVTMAYEDDYFGAPWASPEAVVLVHGVAESSRAWTQWVPLVAADFRVIRPDLPGFGESTVPSSYDWSPAQYAADLVGLLDVLELENVHLVAAKYGGTIAMSLASTWPSRVKSLAVFSSPVVHPATVKDAEDVRENGVREWAARTQRSRLGSAASEAQLKWWTDDLMGIADARAVTGCQMALATSTVGTIINRITAPTVIATAEESGLQTVDAARAYQRLIPNSRLEILPGDAYHLAAVQVENCADIATDLIRATADNTAGTAPDVNK